MTDSPASNRPESQSRIHLLMIAVMAPTFFICGYFTSTLLNETRVRDQATERFKEFLNIGIDMGYITVDRQKLSELDCIISEAEWEDRDFEQRHEGGEK